MSPRSYFSPVDDQGLKRVTAWSADRAKNEIVAGRGSPRVSLEECCTVCEIELNCATNVLAFPTPAGSRQKKLTVDEILNLYNIIVDVIDWMAADL